MIAWWILGPLVTAGIYFAFVWLYAKRPSVLTLPVLATSLVLVALLLGGRLDLSAYERSTHWLVWLLGPATVALAVPFARRLELVRKEVRALVGSVVVGAVAGIASAIGLARLLGLSRVLTATLAPKSVTTPIAMPISERLGGIPSLTAAIVVVTGVIGMAFGPWLLDRLGVRSRIARGAALGTSAHGVGTAKAIEEGEIEGTAAGVAMIVAGVVTAIVAPLCGGVMGTP